MENLNFVKYVGVNDKSIDLFEGQYVVPNGMTYNSYVILDEKIAVIDTVDKKLYRSMAHKLKKRFIGQKTELLDNSAYGVGSFCKYRKFYE